MEGSVRTFAERMQSKLDKNVHKVCPEMNPDGTGRRWEHCALRWLLFRIRQETNELEAALCDGGTPEGIMDEAADVGNFAMMIHDNVRRKE